MIGRWMDGLFFYLFTVILSDFKNCKNFKSGLPRSRD